jgi:hypothetical protein
MPNDRKIACCCVTVVESLAWRLRDCKADLVDDAGALADQPLSRTVHGLKV